MTETQDTQFCSPISVAPMMDWTDRHCRYFLRVLSPSALLYTEMVTAAALQHGDAARLLEFNEEEHPIALQLGGSDPQQMALAATLGEQRGYDKININVGCPSDRVQSGQFGACLMARPDVVANCIEAMRTAVDVPVSVKTRIGIDDYDSYEFLRALIEASAGAGCTDFVVHARIALLAGLSPKENRSVPPLNYERVYCLKEDYPQLNLTINGGITSAPQITAHLQKLDGVMIGREAYQNPWFLTELERDFGANNNGNCSNLPVDRVQAVILMLPYIESQLARGVALKQMTRHLLGIFAGQPGARAWRRFLSEHSHRPGSGIEVLRNALQRLPQAA